MFYSFNEAEAPDRHETQYFEIFGNRGIYHKGWTAVTKHKTSWELVGGSMPALDDVESPDALCPVALSRCRWPSTMMAAVWAKAGLLRSM